MPEMRAIMRLPQSEETDAESSCERNFEFIMYEMKKKVAVD